MRTLFQVIPRYIHKSMLISLLFLLSVRIGSRPTFHCFSGVLRICREAVGFFLLLAASEIISCLFSLMSFKKAKKGDNRAEVAICYSSSKFIFAYREFTLTFVWKLPNSYLSDSKVLTSSTFKG